MRKGRLIWVGVIGLVVLLAVVLAGCASAPGDCTECHNDTTLVYSKSVQSAETVHQTGGSYVRGSSTSCTACHSSEGFTEMVATGIGIEDFEEATPNPSPPNCRTCHQIHTTYTAADWALTTTAPVTLLASGETFDSGKGNLCATCHQPRREMVVEDGIVNVSSTHWGPHHGPQSAMLLGIGGYGASGSPSAHYRLVEDGCPVCHLANDSHTLAASTVACQSCHADAENFDIGGLQTEVEALIIELEELLEAKGLYHDGHPVVGKYPEAEAGALWNYITIVVEDGSKGVHNPTYTKALLQAAIDALK